MRRGQALGVMLIGVALAGAVLAAGGSRVRDSLSTAGAPVAASSSPAPHVQPATVSGMPKLDHLFVIVEENEESPSIIGNANAPTINQLAQLYGTATNYFGVTHPSEPNYVAMLGGSFFGIQDDAPYTSHLIQAQSLADQLEAAGLTWKVYSQSMPSVGFTDTCYPAAECLYASKHNGLMNFAHVSGNPSELQNMVPVEALGPDLLTGNAPNLAIIVPDQCHDMHGVDDICSDNSTNITVADTYLQDILGRIMGSQAWEQGQNAIVVTFDEGDGNLGCCDANPGGGRIVTIVITSYQAGGAVADPTPYNHYSLLATIEQAFRLECIGATCDTANVKPMTPLF